MDVSERVWPFHSDFTRNSTNPLAGSSLTSSMMFLRPSISMSLTMFPCFIAVTDMFKSPYFLLLGFSFQILQDVVGSRIEHRYRISCRSRRLVQKVIVTFSGHKWPWLP